jgi:hypothetical protein
LHFCLLGHLQRVIDLDPEVDDGALRLRVSEQELNGPKIAGPSSSPAHRASAQ